MEINWKKVLIISGVIIALIFTFWYGGNAPGLQGWKIQVAKEGAVKEKEDKEASKDGLEEKDEKEEKKLEEEIEKKKEIKDEKKDNKQVKEKKPEKPGGNEGKLSASEKVQLAKEMAGDSSKGVEKGSKSYSETQGMKIDSKTGKDKYLTDPVPEGKPIPVEPQDVEVTDEVGKATLSVECNTILDNMDWLVSEKVELVPEDGVIYAKKEVEFFKGESVFDVLLREMKGAKIHMEFSGTPIYNSIYIEGINNLYEFDCGELSGWMYKVNDWFPNYGASRYAVKEGDVIEWVYTCDLGADVGGFDAMGGK